MPIIRCPSGAGMLALGLCLLMTGGCAHFRNAHERAMEDRPAQEEQAKPAPQAARHEPRVKQPKQPKQPRHAKKAPSPVVAEKIPVARIPIATAPVEKAPVESAPPVEAPEVDIMVQAPVDIGKGVIVLATVPGNGCAECDTTKISVATGGKVLIERGHWSGGEWHYRRTVAKVRKERAKAFAGRLNRLRPVILRDRSEGGACVDGHGKGRGLKIDWLSGDRLEHLSIDMDCLSQGDPALYEMIRQAPDALGLRQLAMWDGGK